MKISRLSLLLGAFCLIAPTSTFAADASDAAFEKSMDAYLAKDQNVEKVGSALERFFRKKRDEQAQQAQQQEANQMEEQFKNPVKVDVGSSPVRGNPQAKITVVEFSDFECPFCKRGADTMEALLKEYPNDVKVVFKHMPLPFHENAKPASRAAIAAGNQGKFWEMHDLLFSNQDALNVAKFEEHAKKIGLDVAKFKADMEDAKADAIIEADAKQGQSLGVQGTPGFFVNGVQVRGARPVKDFKVIVDRWLKK